MTPDPQSRWAPIVHGRTYAIDYRPNLIVTPRGFIKAGRLGWARQYILAMSSGLTYDSKPRWLVVRDRDFCLIGVCCNADLVSKEQTHDIERRLIPVFLGYVARHPFPPLPPRHLEMFGDLYGYVKERWEEPQSLADQIHERDYTIALDTARQPAGSTTLNTSRQRLVIDPSEADDLLWSAANSPYDFALCLGLANVGEAEQSPFTHVTVRNLTRQRTLERRETLPERPDYQHHPDRPTPPAEPSLFNGMARWFNDSFGQVRDTFCGERRGWHQGDSERPTGRSGPPSYRPTADPTRPDHTPHGFKTKDQLPRQQSQRAVEEAQDKNSQPGQSDIQAPASYQSGQPDQGGLPDSPTPRQESRRKTVPLADQEIQPPDPASPAGQPDPAASQPLPSEPVEPPPTPARSADDPPVA